MVFDKSYTRRTAKTSVKRTLQTIMKDTSEEKMCNKIRSVYLALAVLTRGSARELSWSLGVAVFVGGIWAGVASDWYAWYADGRHMLWAKASYAFLDGRWRVHMPIVMLLGAGMFWWWRQIWEDRDVRWLRLWLPLLGIFLLCWEYDEGAYVCIVWLLDYRHLLLFLLGGTALLSVGQILREVKRRADSCEEEAAIGFSEDAPSDAKISEHLKAYVALIIRRLRVTQILQQSYAIGLVGQWGSGKSTLLYEFREQIVQGGAAEIVAFNPWLCNSPEQITKDFFAALREQLSKKYSSLSKSIREYANSVADLSVQIPFFAGVQAALRNDDESLQEKKEKLSKLFARLPHKVFVFIDDMDRLESEEVFEVLRLIRNTADLSNVVYVVAYDKEYVTRVLEEKKICDPAAYLEKIFQIEVPLPKVEGYQLWETLKEGIAVQLVHTHHISNRGFVEALFCGFNQSQRTLILRVLNTYRRAKRFARLYALIVTYFYEGSFIEKTGESEIKLLNLFWLELLQVYDTRTYNLLACNPEAILFTDSEGVMTLKQESEVVNRREIRGKEKTWEILSMIFSNEGNTRTRGIRNIEHYDKYFALSVSPFRVSIKESFALLKSDAPEDLLMNWINEGKQPASILYQLEWQNKRRLGEKQLEAYLRAVLYMGLIYTRMVTVLSARRMLEDVQYSDEMRLRAQEIVVNWFENKINEHEVYWLGIGQLLNRLYVACVDDEKSWFDPYSLVISNDSVRRLLQKVMNSYLDRHSQLSAVDVMSFDSDLGKLFACCCLLATQCIVFPESDHYCQIVFPAVIAFFEKKESKPTQEEYVLAYGKMRASILDEQDGYDEVNDSFVEEKIREHFGDDWRKNLEEFRNRCFE